MGLICVLIRAREKSSFLRISHQRSILAILFLILSLIATADELAQYGDEPFLQEARDARLAGDINVALHLLDSLIEGADGTEEPILLANYMIEKGILHQMHGQYGEALKLLQRAQSLFTKAGYKPGLAEVLNNMGSIHHENEALKKAADYYEKSLRVYEELGMKKEIARAYNNIGALLEDSDDPRSALEQHRKSLDIWKELGEKSWEGISYIHQGRCFELMGGLDSAMFYLQKSLEIFQSTTGDFQRTFIYIRMGEVQRKQNRLEASIFSCSESLKLSERLNSLRYQQQSCECLFKTYELLDEPRKALAFYKRSGSLSDSIFGEEQVKFLTKVEMDYAFQRQLLNDSLARAKEQAELELAHREEVTEKREERNVMILVAVCVILLAGGIYSRLRVVNRAKDLIKKEKERSESLLLNILPAEIAEELKQTGRAEAREFSEATILFTDFKGFTSASEKMSAQLLIAEINTCFEAFDAIVEDQAIEKIKTIGDSYMAAGGIPVPNEEAALNTIKAALEMNAFMKQRQQAHQSAGLPVFEMRIGIHSGPVVAGIVGVKKFQYDVWGDTVNTASRMESTGAVGRVNISHATYQLVKYYSKFRFISRGNVHVKGKGEMEMYFVEYEKDIEEKTSSKKRSCEA